MPTQQRVHGPDRKNRESDGNADIEGDQAWAEAEIDQTRQEGDRDRGQAQGPERQVEPEDDRAIGEQQQDQAEGQHPEAPARDRQDARLGFPPRRGRLDGGCSLRFGHPSAGHCSAIVLGAFLEGGEALFQRVEAMQQRQHGGEVPAAAAARQHAPIERGIAVGADELVLHGNLAP